MGKMKLLRDVVDNLHDLASSISDMADAIEGKAIEAKPEILSPVEQAKTESSSTVSIETLREVMSSLSVNGNTAQVKALLLKYNASKLSDVKPEHFAALLAEAKLIK